MSTQARREVMTVKEVCDLYRIHRSTFYRYTMRQKDFPEPIPCTGSKRVYRAKEIRQFAGLD